MALHAPSIQEKGEINYLRLTAAINNVAPKALRNFFLQQHPDIQRDLSNNRDALKQLKSRKIITPHQWDLLYPYATVVNPMEFDVSLICLLLRHLTTVDPPVRGWNKDPLPGDTSVGADIMRIRMQRNFIAHSSATKTMTNTEFALRWSELSDAVLRLGGGAYNAELQKWLTITVGNSDNEVLHEITNLRKQLQSLRDEVRNASPRKDIFSRKLADWEEDDKFYVRRKAELKLLKFLKTDNVVTVVGYTGSGKTFLVHHIALKMSRKGYQILPIIEPSEFIKYFRSSERQVFVVENPCGVHSLNDTEFDRWLRYTNELNMCMEISDTKLIFTSRTIVTASKFFRTPPCILNRNVINISSPELNFSQRERGNLLNVYVPNLTDIHSVVQFDHVSFPLICKLLRQEPSLQPDIGEILRNPDPYQIHNNEFDRLERKDPSNVFCLLMCFVFCNEIDECWFSDTKREELRCKVEQIKDEFSVTCSVARIKPTLSDLIGVYLKEENGIYSFLNISLYDAFAIWVSRKYTIVHVLQYCTGSFLRENIRFKSNSNIIDNKTVYIEKCHFEKWFEKIESKIFSGNLYDVFASPSLQQSIPFLVNKLRNMPHDLLNKMMTVECTSNINQVQTRFDYHWYDIEQHDKMDWQEISEICSNRMRTFLLETSEAKAFHWFMAYTSADLCKTIWIRLNSQTQEILRRYPFLSISVATGDSALLKFALSLLPKKEVRLKFRENPLLVAAFCGHAKSTAMLLRYGCSPNETYNAERIAPVHMSAKNGHLDILKLLCSRGSKINSSTKDGTTALILAVKNCHTNVIHFLLKRRAQLSSTQDGTTLLMYASKTGDYDILNRIFTQDPTSINVQNMFGITALYLAVHYEHIKLVSFLLNNGADADLVRCDDGSSPLHAVAQNGNHNIMHELKPYITDINKTDRYGQTPLFVASYNNHKDSVSLLLKSGALPNIQRSVDMVSPLYIAAELGLIDVVATILEFVSDINVPNVDGNTPLAIAATNGHTEICEKLLSRGADVSVRNRNGFSVILIAAKAGNTKLICNLLQCGADINSHTFDENLTPLMLSCIMGHYNVAKFLLQSDADASLLSKSGFSAYDLATQMRHSSISTLLKDSEKNKEFSDISLSDDSYTDSDTDSKPLFESKWIDSILTSEGGSSVLYPYNDN